MRKTLQVMAWIAIVIGVLAILGSFSDSTGEAYSSFIGGILFAGLGWMVLAFIKKTDKKLRDLYKGIAMLEERILRENSQVNK